MIWTVEDIPALNGEVAMVTGASSGLGFVTSLALASRGAEVHMVCRNEQRAKTTFDRLPSTIKHKVTMRVMDLSDLDDVEHAAAKCKVEMEKLDILINNAGVMEPPFTRTKQGFELQFGVNHLGHFALTTGLFPLLATSKKARVITQSSLAAENGGLDIDEFNRTGVYSGTSSYSHSKLANLLFAVELDRRHGSQYPNVTSIATHPGYARTDLQRHARGAMRKMHVRWTQYRYAQSAEKGALPLLRAATDLSIRGGSYVVPGGPGQLAGSPVIAPLPRVAQDAVLASELWEQSVLHIAQSKDRACG
ncbi:MAG: SDR family oxidoreductase [Flavobacteriales bacterium]